MAFEKTIVKEPAKNTIFGATYPDVIAKYHKFKRMSDQLRKTLVGELKNLIGDENVSDDPAICASYGGAPFLIPEIIVRPKTVEHVQATLKLANKHAIPVTPTAGAVGGWASTFCIPCGIVLDMAGMNRIVEINTDEGYVVLEPGVTHGQLYKALDPLGYWHAKGYFNPQVGVFGPATTQVQGHRASGGFDDVLGFEVVLPDGVIVRTGGASVEQGSWSHQYFNFPDIHGLWLNANGTLGVVTKFALKIYPKGEISSLHITGFDSTEAAVKFCQKVCLHRLAEHMIIWHWKSMLLNEQWSKMIIGKMFDQNLIPYDTWGPRGFFEPPDGIPLWTATTIFEGFKEIVEAQLKICDKIARENGGKVYSIEEFKQIFPYSHEFLTKFLLKHELTAVIDGAVSFLSPLIVMGFAGLTSPKNLLKLERDIVEFFENKEGMSVLTMSIQPFDQGRMMLHDFTVLRLSATYEELRKDIKKLSPVELTKKYGWLGQKPPTSKEEAKAILELTGGYYEVLKRIKKALDPNNIMSPHVWPEG